MKRLERKTAVVTGGSKGIGKAIALALAKEGCNVAISSRTGSELKKAAKEIAQTGVEVLTVEADMRRFSDCEALAKAVENKFGRTNILINNAGIGGFADILNMEEEMFRAVLETNLFGVFYCTKLFLPHMISNKGGHIVNISSLAGKNSFAGGSAYCASKHALLSFAECLMLEIRHHNIKVTTICPGSVQTDFGETSRQKTWALSAEDVAKTVTDVLTSSAGSLVSLLDLRPLNPPKK